MRLTLPLCKRTFRNQWKNLFRRTQRNWKDFKGGSENYDLSKVKYYDAVDLFMKQPKVSPKSFLGRVRQFQPVEPDKPIRFYDNTTILPAGLNQMLVFSKTLKYDHLPESVENISKSVGDYVDNMAARVEALIKGIVIGRSDQEKIQKKLNYEEIPDHIPNVFGNTTPRVVKHLLMSLTQFPLSAAMDIDPNLNILSNQLLRSKVFLEKDGKPICLLLDLPKLWLTKKPLPNFADAAQVEASKDVPLVDIYPIDSLMQWKRQPLDFEPGDVHWVGAPEQKYICPHTVFSLNDSYELLPDENHVNRCLASCISVAINYARLTYGADVVTLPQPITVQGIYLDKSRIGFLIYQLNTLDFNGVDGIKNMVWLGPFRRMYTPGHYNDLVEEYDPRFLKNMISFALTGFNSDSLSMPVKENLQTSQ